MMASQIEYRNENRFGLTGFYFYLRQHRLFHLLKSEKIRWYGRWYLGFQLAFLNNHLCNLTLYFLKLLFFISWQCTEKSVDFFAVYLSNCEFEFNQHFFLYFASTAWALICLVKRSLYTLSLLGEKWLTKWNGRHVHS